MVFLGLPYLLQFLAEEVRSVICALQFVFDFVAAALLDKGAVIGLWVENVKTDRFDLLCCISASWQFEKFVGCQFLEQPNFPLTCF